MKKIISVLITMILFAPPADACPFCKEALAKMGQVWTGIGFNLSIYLMIAVPFLLVGSFTFVLFLNYRKQK